MKVKLKLKMNCHLVCGYKRSGKDTFYKAILNNKILSIENDINKLEDKSPIFYILSKKEKDKVSLVFNIKNIPLQVALANMVKKEVQSNLKIKFNKPELEEICKDYLSFFDEEKGRYKTLRENYIEHAMKMRKETPEHWCKEAEDYIFEKKKEITDLSDFVVTDWRFPNERIFFEHTFKCYTYRIYREEADDENFFDETEHSLDYESTDFLVLGKIDDFETAKNRFPQYEGYEITHFIF